MNNAKGWFHVHKALSEISTEKYKKTRLRVEELLERMPKSALLRHEHGAPGNTVEFYNRADGSGMGVYFNMPFFDDFQFFRSKEGEKPDEHFLQEARLLIVPNGISNPKKRENEAIIHATAEQIRAILELSLAIGKAKA